ncbi:MAG: septal ring lytic transglycosylase RlpA family protein [Rubrobacteraceae bacterium]
MNIRQTLSLTLLILAAAIVGMAAFAQTLAWAPPAPETTVASWYGAELAGSIQANGEPFDPSQFTAASKTLPLGTRLLVRHEGRAVAVTVEDRGPYVAGRDLDLSRAAADSIGIVGKGTGAVEITVVPGEATEPTSGAAGPELPVTRGGQE